ncbi:MAG: peroxidase-related enzyme [bacterium]|nr:peroxidase-related enzyme [Acidimicrobiia bacterium]MCY4648932.1 peroxidase-related enzyme [bacterium]
MTDNSRFPMSEISELPEDLRERAEFVYSKLGFTPNVMLAMGHRPEEARAFFAYHDALMEREEGLSKAEREMIVVATSSANECPYCIVAHGAILRIRSGDPLIADQIAANWRTAPVSDRQRAMLRFAVKLARTPEAVEEADYEPLYEQGFNDDHVWEIGAITAFFAMSNRLAHLGHMAPNPEFYLLGRLPRK